ncbi:MAG TPA: sigma factor-like helix-turn-helix DNA-binding protein, partial [Candidatus Polarisedimenticolia bacterium]
IVNRFGLGGGASFSLSEIGRCLGVSRERVRQIEDQSKKRLRRFLKRQDRPARNARPSPAVSARITDRTASCATPSCTT